MSEYLALDWESHQISGLEAITTRQGITVRKAFVLTWPEDINPEKDTEQAAHWLKNQLARQGISTRNVLVSLPRESVVVRRLTVPNAPDEELPALVQMQAATKSSTPMDQLELDFLPLPLASPDSGRDVLMCTMAKKKTAKVRAILERAGLELECLGISSFATAELIARDQKARKLDSSETSLIIARHGHRVEISILQQHTIIFSHSTQLHSDDEHPRGNESLIVAEVQRSLVSLHPQSGRLRVDRAWLVGEEEEFAELAAVIEKRLKCESTTLNPEFAHALSNQAQDWPKPIGAFAGPAGLLLGRTDSAVGAIDFQNPRKQRPRRDLKKLRMIAAAAILGVLFIGAMGYRWWKVGDLQNEITQKRGQIDQLKQVVKQGEPTMKSAGHVGEWDQKANKELAQIAQLYSAMPGTDLMYLVRYELKSAPANSLGIIQGEGRAKSEPDVREFFDKLYNRGIKARASTRKQSPDSDYPVQFTLDLELPLPASPRTLASAPQS
jgi:Tfp pilus assembly PilM family ATPase/outer membrane murein-binding lipoprotein Lpp